MSQLLKVLLIDDSDEDGILIFRALRKEGYETVSERVETEADLLAALNARKWDIILCDYKMPFLDCLRALQLVKQFDTAVPFILISAFINDMIAEKIIRAGADAYISKDNLGGLTQIIETELIKAKLKSKNRPAQKKPQAIE